jgi:hypothetical protein
MPMASTVSAVISWKIIHFIVAPRRQIDYRPNSALTRWMEHFHAEKPPTGIDRRTRVRIPAGRDGARAAQSQLQILLVRRSGRSPGNTTFALRRLVRRVKQTSGMLSKVM